MPADPEEDLSHLELPSLFRRRKRKDRDAEPVETPATEAEPPVPAPVERTATTDAEPAETPASEIESPTAAQPAATTEVEPAEAPTPPADPPAPAPVEPAATTEVEPVETPAVPEVETTTVPPNGHDAQDETDTQVVGSPVPVVTPDDTTVLPPVEPEPAPQPETPAAAPRPRPTLATHFRRRPRRAEPAEAARSALTADAATTEPDVAAVTDTEPDPTRWAPSGQVAPAADRAPAEPDPSEQPERGPSPVSRLAGRLAAVRLPHLPGYVAAAITGAVTGLVGVGLVVLVQLLSQAARGTSNAGAAGLFLLIGIVALCVYLGSVGLRAWGQSDTLSVSFLGVGLVVVLVMLFLLPVIFSWAMALVVPLLGAAAFALSWWVSNRLGPEARRLNDEYSPEVHR